MKVRLISITKPIGIEELTAEEDLLVFIARVSNPNNQLNVETGEKLLRHMIKNRHWSPFDMVNMTVEVVTSKAVAIQILRHWSIKPQEFSQRYAEVVDIEPIELRRQAEKNRQSSFDVFNPTITLGKFSRPADEIVDALVSYTKEVYGALLKAGVAKECARMILPMASSTTMYLNGSVRSWIHYLEQRTDSHAQLEHQRVAAEIKKIFVTNFPKTSKALYDNTTTD